MPLGLDQKIHVANHLDQDIYVMPTLDKGWLLADVLADTALFAIGVGEIATATGLALPAELATFADLTQFLKATAGLLSGTRPSEPVRRKWPWNWWRPSRRGPSRSRSARA